MNDYNAEIRLDIKNLQIPLKPIQAMQCSGIKVKLTGVPSCALSVSVIIFKPDGTHFAPYPLSQDGNGDWFGFVIGACFPTAGRAKYQIAYTDCESHQFAGGKGNLVITDFEPPTGGQVTPEGDIIITEIPSEDGTMHRVVAKNIGTAQNQDWSIEIRS